MKEAEFYRKGVGILGTEVLCELCPNRCQIKRGHVGFCRVRYNGNGKLGEVNTLYTLNYNKISGMAMDPIEKKPLYEFNPGSKILSLGSFGCNLHCKHCQNSDISQITGAIDNTPKNIVTTLENVGQEFSVNDLTFFVREKTHKQIAFTYNEPIVWYEYVFDVAKRLKNAGVSVVLVTNGYINPEPLRALLPYVDALSLDIKWYSQDAARKLSGVIHPEAVRATATAAYKAGKHLEIVTNVVHEHNDAEHELAAIANFIAGLDTSIPWHISRAFPAHKLKNIPITSREKLEKTVELGRRYGLRNIYLGNI